MRNEGNVWHIFQWFGRRDIEDISSASHALPDVCEISCFKAHTYKTLKILKVPKTQPETEQAQGSSLLDQKRYSTKR